MACWLGGSLECPVVDMSGDENEPPHQQRCPGNDHVYPLPDNPSPSTSSRTTRSRNVRSNVTPVYAKKPLPKKAVIQSPNNVSRRQSVRRSVTPVVPVKKIKKKKDTPQKPPKISVIEAENADCPVCKEEVESDAKALQCDRCNLWNHAKCLDMSDEEYVLISNSCNEWYCVGCRVIKNNQIKRGSLDGEDEISEMLGCAYG